MFPGISRGAAGSIFFFQKSGNVTFVFSGHFESQGGAVPPNLRYDGYPKFEFSGTTWNQPKKEFKAS